MQDLIERHIKRLNLGNQTETHKKLSEVLFIKADILDIINQLILNNIFNKTDIEEIPPEKRVYIEGQLQEIKVNYYKRNQKIVKKVKERDNYTCQACNFYYEQKIVEAHHLKPLSTIKKETISTKNDLITLCSYLPAARPLA